MTREKNPDMEADLEKQLKWMEEAAGFDPYKVGPYPAGQVKIIDITSTSLAVMNFESLTPKYLIFNIDVNKNNPFEEDFFEKNKIFDITLQLLKIIQPPFAPYIKLVRYHVKGPKEVIEYDVQEGI